MRDIAAQSHHAGWSLFGPGAHDVEIGFLQLGLLRLARRVNQGAQACFVRRVLRLVLDRFPFRHPIRRSQTNLCVLSKCRRGVQSQQRAGKDQRREVQLWIASSSYPMISLFLKQKAISFFAVSGASEPCTEFF